MRDDYTIVVVKVRKSEADNFRRQALARGTNSYHLLQLFIRAINSFDFTRLRNRYCNFNDRRSEADNDKIIKDEIKEMFDGLVVNDRWHADDRI